jgi:membrane-associated phospholipid phosphatase
MLAFELEIVRLIQSLRNPIFDFSLFAITQIGDQMVFILISVIIYWTIHKKYAFYFVFTFMISAILNAGLKLIFTRLRPFHYEGIQMLPQWETSGYSFPSGHAQSAGVLGFYGIDASKKTNKKVFKIIAILIMIFVPLSRIYLGQHFLSDVLVGVLLSFGVAYLCYKGLNKIGDKEEYLALSLAPVMLLLMILNPSHDIAVASGAFIGFSVGYFLEKRYVKYIVKTSLVAQFVKVIFGLAVLMGIRLGLGAIFPDTDFFDFIRYIVIGLWASVLAPMVFKYAHQKRL